MNVLQQLYDSEINFALSSFWDGGITAQLGDELNGFVAEKTFAKVCDAEKWLCEQARIHFPDSEFAKSAPLPSADSLTAHRSASGLGARDAGALFCQLANSCQTFSGLGAAIGTAACVTCLRCGIMGYPVENSISPLWEAFPLASKGRPKPSLRDLSRLPMDVNSYFDELTAESDRACALIAAAAVADGLRDLIYQYCFNISKEEYEHIFYSQNAVLGSLANRAEIAKALGLISPEEYGAISVIRRVRNEFSHSMAQFTFDNELIRAELDKLSNFLTKIGDAELPKTMFIRASMSIYLFLSHRCGYLYNKTGGLAIPIPIYREATPTPSPEK